MLVDELLEYQWCLAVEYANTHGSFPTDYLI